MTSHVGHRGRLAAWLTMVGALLAAAMVPGTAEARGRVGVYFGFPLAFGPPAYYAPPPYYYPPPVVYAPPPPAYYAPPPAFYAPPAVATAPQQTCREYQSTVMIAGQPQQTHGTACLQPDGSWRIVR